MDVQNLILTLSRFWSEKGCVLQQPYDTEVGAGTFHPATFFRVLGPNPWKVAFVQPSRRPTDGRYGQNPMRLQHYYQFQVVLKPSPSDVLDQYLQSLEQLGIQLKSHDVRFVEDDWESPTLGAWGLGWEVWLDSLEITQFTYFQQCGSIDLDVISCEITYGLERIAMFLQQKDSLFDIQWNDEIYIPDLYSRLTVLDHDDRLMAHLGDWPEGWKTEGWPNLPKSTWVPGRFSSPHDLHVDGKGNIYVVEWLSGGTPKITKLVRRS